MQTLSSEIEKEIEHRLALGNYGSADELVREALKALDDAKEGAYALLERELLLGLEGDDAEMTGSDWDTIEREALGILEAKKTQ